MTWLGCPLVGCRLHGMTYSGVLFVGGPLLLMEWLGFPSVDFPVHWRTRLGFLLVFPDDYQCLNFHIQCSQLKF